MSRDRNAEHKFVDQKAELTVGRNNRVIMSREDYRRKKQNMEGKNKLYVDVSKVPPGMRYKWIRISIYNEPDHSRDSEMKEDGWTPVPADRHPELSSPDFLGRRTVSANFIVRDGLLLCEKPEVYVEVDEEILNEATQRITNSLPALNNPMNDQAVFFDPNRSMTNVTRTYTVRHEKKQEAQQSDFGQ